jgi:hypothetical protein
MKLRRSLAELGDTSAWRRTGALYQLGVNYRWSSIVIDEFGPSASQLEGIPKDPYNAGNDGFVRAGDRAPDAPGLIVLAGIAAKAGCPMTTLFDIFNPSCHTALIFFQSSTIQPLESVLKALRRFPVGTLRTVLVLREASFQGLDEFSMDLAVHDSQGYGCQGYNISSGIDLVVVLVRPDAYVGAIVRGADGVDQYFKTIFNSMIV